MADRKYILMRWKDGWQEVVGVDSDALEFIRYYVIERVEYVGRLVVKRGEEDCPGLLIIDCSPMEIEKVMMIEDGDECNLIQSSKYREGSRIEYHYDLQKGGKDFIEDIKKGIRDFLSKKGLSSEVILSKPEKERIKEIEDIGKTLKIVGSKCQEDLIGFIQFLLNNLD